MAVLFYFSLDIQVILRVNNPLDSEIDIKLSLALPEDLKREAESRTTNSSK